MRDESVNKLSTLRLKGHVIKSLIKIAAKIILAFTLAIVLSAGVYLIINNDRLNKNMPAIKNISNNQVATEIVFKERKIKVAFTNTIHTDEWEMFYNNDLVGHFKTENGIQASWDVAFKVEDTSNNALLLKSKKGKQQAINIADNQLDALITVEGDYKPVTATLLLQNPELPNGCEATSLAMLLSAAGVETDKIAAAQAIPTEDFTTNEKGILFAPDPEQFYAGLPESKSRGFYAFVPPVKKAADKLLAEAGICLQAIDLSGNDFEIIDGLIENNVAVMLWITIDYSALRYCKNFSWIKTSDNQSYLPIANLHCVVATDKTESGYKVLDPIKGEIEVTFEKLKYVYEQMGKRAICIG